MPSLIDAIFGGHFFAAIVASLLYHVLGVSWIFDVHERGHIGLEAPFSKTITVVFTPILVVFAIAVLFAKDAVILKEGVTIHTVRQLYHFAEKIALLVAFLPSFILHFTQSPIVTPASAHLMLALGFVFANKAASSHVETPGISYSLPEMTEHMLVGPAIHVIALMSVLQVVTGAKQPFRLVQAVAAVTQSFWYLTMAVTFGFDSWHFCFGFENTDPESTYYNANCLGDTPYTHAAIIHVVYPCALLLATVYAFATLGRLASRDGKSRPWNDGHNGITLAARNSPPFQYTELDAI